MKTKAVFRYLFACMFFLFVADAIGAPSAWPEDDRKEWEQLLARTKHHWDEGQFDKAFPNIEKATLLAEQFVKRHELPASVLIQSVEEVVGKDHVMTGAVFAQLAQVYKTNKNFEDGERIGRHALNIGEAKLDKDSLALAGILFTLAECLDGQRKFAEAEKHFLRALHIRESKLGKDHNDLVPVLLCLIDCYTSQGRFAEAEKICRRFIKLLELNDGKDHPKTAWALKMLAILVEKQSRGEAEKLLRQSLEIQEAALGKDHEDVGDSLARLGILYEDMGSYVEAIPCFQRALAIREKTKGRDHPVVIETLNCLAGAYQKQGRYADAVPLCQRVLEIRETQMGKDDPKVAGALNNLALLYDSMGKFGEAEFLLRRALRIRESKQEEDHLDIAETANNLGAVLKPQGRYDEAEALYQRALKIKEKKLGKDHPDVADTLYNLANIQEERGRLDLAERDHLRVLSIREAKFGKDHPYVAESHGALASVCSERGQYAEAERHYRKALEIKEAKLGKDHPDVAHILNNLARVYGLQKRLEEAEQLNHRALEICEKRLGKDHPDIASQVNNLGVVQKFRQQPENAAKNFDRARRIVRRHLSQEMSVLSEQELLIYLEINDQSKLYTALKLGADNPDKRALVDLSSGWLLNGKGVVQTVLAERALLARERRDPAAAKLVEEVVQVRRQLGQLNFSEIKPGQEEEFKKRSAELAARERELSKELARAAGRAESADPWVEVSQVRKAIPKGAVLIDIAYYRASHNENDPVKAQRWDYRYAAWVIPADQEGEIALVDLGDAGRIEEQTAKVREGFRAVQERAKNPILQKGEREAEEELKEHLEDLAMLVLDPLRKHIRDKKHWLISPDAALWLVPWAALPLQDGSYAIEKYRISYLVSGRDLVTPPAKTTPGRSMIVADPDYDLGLAAARAAARALLDNPETVAELRGITSSSKLPQVARLPGTAAEAAAIKPKLARFAGEEPWVYKDKNAQEAVFKSFKSPKVLVLSTHGFFLEDQEAAPDQNLPSGRREPAERPSKSALLTKDGKLFENPLVRCGLLLAGCNDREGGRTENDEDGVLTGLEIVGTDLRGTELVVLSACETGLGQVRNGEGVAGLRQAFQLAGARAVVATLWQIPDRDSALLMSEFFENLAAGKNKADALREAQLGRIKARRERHGAAHPFFWAAFTLTGQ